MAEARKTTKKTAKKTAKTVAKKAPATKAATKKATAKPKTGAGKRDAKTKPTAASVEDYLAAIADPERQQDCRALAGLMTKITGRKPVMWGPGIVGFDSYHYRYESGHEGDACLLGFASRKSDLTIYVVSGFDGVEPLLAGLGRYKTSKACLYVKRLADLDLARLEALLRHSAAETRRRFG